MKTIALLLAVAAPLFPASISGVIEDTIGTVIPGADATLTSVNGEAHWETQSHEHGVFRFDGLAEGNYVLRAWSTGFSTLKIAVSVRGDEDRTLPALRLDVGTIGDCAPITDETIESTRFLLPETLYGGLAVIVRDNHGPVPGARIVWNRNCWDGCAEQTSTTDAAGRASSAGLWVGRYSVLVEKDGYYQTGRRFEVNGGIESTYGVNLEPCPNGDCTIRIGAAPVPAKVIVCE